jgi:hypothetical protein
MGIPEPKPITGGSDLAAAAEKLRDVKLATRRFLALWALEHARTRLRATDHHDAEAALSDFVKHDWSALYHGCEVDDG